jgi:hypothetical protein
MVGIMNTRQRDLMEDYQEYGHDNDVSEKIEHLMAEYHWTRWEAMEYFYYEPYDPIDWVGSPWEVDECSLPPY